MACGKGPSRARKRFFLDVVRCCGPMVEVIDDHIYFVHFTTKESVLSVTENVPRLT